MDDVDNEALSLKDIEEFGGNERDLALIQDVSDDDDDVESLEEDSGGDSVDENEIRKYWDKLKVKATSTAALEKKKKKKEFAKSTETSRPTLLFSFTDHWYSNKLSEELAAKPDSASVIERYEVEAARLFEHEQEAYRRLQEKRNSSDVGWLKQVAKSGSLSVRMAALADAIQQSALHSLSALQSLLGQVRKKSRREALAALETLKEVLTSELLPPQRQLYEFKTRPLSRLDSMTAGSTERSKRLVLWYFEHQLHLFFQEFITAVQVLLKDPVGGPRSKAMGTLFDLMNYSGQENKALMSLVINKLGDPDPQVSSLALLLLNKYVKKWPSHKTAVVDEVETFLHRPNLGRTAQYYAICFLNQIILNSSENDLAARLISIYFIFFQTQAKKEMVDSKLLGALLTGVNRAFPYASKEREKLLKQADVLYRVVHIAGFNTGVQALALLLQLLGSSESLSDRYFSALYKKLFDPQLRSSSRQPMFLALVCKSMKADPCQHRVKSFVKRLLQLCCLEAPTFACATLLVISEVLSTKPRLLTLSQKAQDDDEEEVYKDVDDDTPAAVVHSNLSSQSSWLHRSNLGGATAGDYDPLARNPLFCHADHECTWELERLTSHYHPSVSLFAKTLVKGEKIKCDGEPFEDFSLNHFLERFVYKNPKKKEKVRNEQNLVLSRAKKTATLGAQSLAVNDPEYADQAEEKVPVQERYIYRFFQNKKTKAEASDDESISDSEFDQYLDKVETDFDGADPDFDGSDPDFDSELDEKLDGNTDSGSEGGESPPWAKMDGLSSDEESEDVGASPWAALETQSDDDSDEDGDDFPAPSSSDDEGPAVPKKTKKGGMNGLFAAAEEFSHILDEHAGNKANSTGFNAVRNPENAHLKQLRWEQGRMGEGRKRKAGGRNKHQGKKRR